MNYHLHMVCTTLILITNVSRLARLETKKSDKIFDILVIIYGFIFLVAYALHWYCESAGLI